MTLQFLLFFQYTLAQRSLCQGVLCKLVQNCALYVKGIQGGYFRCCLQIHMTLQFLLFFQYTLAQRSLCQGVLCKLVQNCALYVKGIQGGYFRCCLQIHMTLQFLLLCHGFVLAVR
eukprot:TRINITY_DN13098_c0_g1_i1.p3 TRINITY_DN13098_c0_g1~~TRINITY_DN13098_c0_g1_i1.p3  ORF type:complete len:116 (+),score=2.49 TRINITY_DN13098_c0_g1_i1:1-348(+)